MDNTSKDSLEQLNKDILVSIADDCMTAYICLKNPGTEICYGYEDVKKALDESGFNLIEIYKGDTFEKPDEKTERIVYISEKRNK